MDAKTPRRLLAAAVAVSLLAQTTGAADLAGVLAGPGFRTPLPPGLVARPKPTVAPVTAPAEPWFAGLAETPAGKTLIGMGALMSLLADDFRLKGSPDEAAETAVARRAALKRVKESLSTAPAFTASVLAFTAFVWNLLRQRPLLTKIEGPWIERPGLRFRVNFVDSLGVSWMDAAGMHSYVPYGGRENEPGRFDERYFHRYATYFDGQRVHYEVEIENTGAEPLRDLRVWANLEQFEPNGGRGAAVAAAPSPYTAEALATCLCVGLHLALSGLRFGAPGRAYAPSALAALAPGERRVLNRTIALGAATKKVTFEQVHLLVTATDRVLADEPQAGIVDPPAHRLF